MIKTISDNLRPTCPVCGQALKVHLTENEESRDCYWTCKCLKNIENEIINGKFMADSYEFDGRFQG